MKIYDKVISLYVKLTKRNIIRDNKKNTTMYLSNGSTVRSPKTKEGNVIRGQRAKMDFLYYDTFYTQEELDEILKPYVKGEDYD